MFTFKTSSGIDMCIRIRDIRLVEGFGRFTKISVEGLDSPLIADIPFIDMLHFINAENPVRKANKFEVSELVREKSHVA